MNGIISLPSFIVCFSLIIGNLLLSFVFTLYFASLLFISSQRFGGRTVVLKLLVVTPLQGSNNPFTMAA